MRTIEEKIYSFNELSENIKAKVLSDFVDINVDYNWWDCLFEDANNIGFKINTFDIDSNSIDGEFIDSGTNCCQLILDKHGRDSSTFKLAKKWLADYDEMVEKYEDPYKKGKVREDCYEEFDKELDEMEYDLCLEIKEYYLKKLIGEYDYQTSNEAIIENISINNYEFYENGELYKDGKQY